jgi:hypothetical protein
VLDRVLKQISLRGIENRGDFLCKQTYTGLQLENAACDGPCSHLTNKEEVIATHSYREESGRLSDQFDQSLPIPWR